MRPLVGMEINSRSNKVWALSLYDCCKHSLRYDLITRSKSGCELLKKATVEAVNRYPNTDWGAILTNSPKMYPRSMLALQSRANLLHHQLERCFCFFPQFPRIQFRAVSKVLNCSGASVEKGDKSLALFGVRAHVYLWRVLNSLMPSQNSWANIAALNVCTILYAEIWHWRYYRNSHSSSPPSFLPASSAVLPPRHG